MSFNNLIATPWIQTYTGRAFDLLDPQPEQIDIVDIAHALSHLCRFTGHCDRFYSVAQHSCLVAEIVWELWKEKTGAHECPAVVLLAALLHDAPEAYVGDVSTPLKRALRGEGQISEYDAIEAQIHRVVWRRFGIEGAAVLVPHALVGRFTDMQGYVAGLIKRADLIALATEHRDLFTGPTPRSWGFELPQPWAGRVEPWPSNEARREFLYTFERYGGVR